MSTGQGPVLTGWEGNLTSHWPWIKTLWYIHLQGERPAYTPQSMPPSTFYKESGVCKHL